MDIKLNCLIKINFNLELAYNSLKLKQKNTSRFAIIHDE